MVSRNGTQQPALASQTLTSQPVTLHGFLRLFVLKNPPLRTTEREQLVLTSLGWLPNLLRLAPLSLLFPAS